MSAEFPSGSLRLGALVVILSIAADPFNQQLIQYEQRVVYRQDLSTMVNRAGRYAKGRDKMRITDVSSDGMESQIHAFADADLSMQSAILYGIDQPMENVFQQGSFNCPTGNCTWPPYESLAVCNRCTDITARLESIVSKADQYHMEFHTNIADPTISNCGTAFRLPNGLYLDNVNGWKYVDAAVLMTTLGTANDNETISAHDMDTLIWSMSMIRVSPDATSVAWPHLPLSAMECALFYCVNSYEFKVSNGSLTATIDQVLDAKRAADSWVNELSFEASDESTFESIAYEQNSFIAPHTDLMLVSPETRNRFNISQPAVDGISSYYQSTFASKLFDFNINDAKRGRLNGYYVNSSISYDYEPSVMQTLFASQDLNTTFTTLAASMSNAIRTGSDATFDGVPNIVTGSKGELITFYRVVWPWISLHCFIVVTGVMFLLLTVRENRKHGRAVPMWKSSSLAVLNRGQEVAGILSGMQTLEQMEAMSKTSQVILFDKGAEGSSLEQIDFDPLEFEN
ncbi:hypothetical protein F5883DRAFT_627033 [Diaporthe sp. PMI_573]|nr:hypothetical protein F5883DRAFT_627033 [Diaporthaceae sp. PMI_573]